MIVIKLIGGLGNQMYQYAYGLQLANEYHEPICFDTSFYKSGKQLALYNLNVPQYPLWEEVVSEAEQRHVKLWQKSFHVAQKLIRIFKGTDRTGDMLYLKLAAKGFLFNFDPYYYDVPRCTEKNKYIYGYFQGEQYFSECKQQLAEQFTVRCPLSEKAKRYEKQICGANAVALHIRLGDYKKAANRNLDVCTAAYYQRAIRYIYDHTDNPAFFVFSNDTEKAAQMLKLADNAVFVEGTKDYEDFALLKQCRHFVLSNSTFSWWAAYLAANTEKIVTVPDKWRRFQVDEPAIYMPNMIKLPITERGAETDEL